MNRPELPAVGLDSFEDLTASAQDRNDDAALATLVRTRLLALELPPSQVDVAAVTRGGGGLGRRRHRRRAAWGVAGAVAAAATVVVAVAVSGGGHAGPAVNPAVGVDSQDGPPVMTGEDGSLLLVSDADVGGGMQARGGGTLTRTSEGCLGWDLGSNRFQLVLWPFGTTWDSTSEVLSVPGWGDFRLGQEMHLGGGESEIGYAGEQMPTSCTQEKTWIAFNNAPFREE